MTPRTLILSLRGQPADVARAAGFEWEDLIATWEGAELIAPPRGHVARADRWGRWAQRALRHAPALAQRLAPTPSQARYELLVVVCRSPQDLLRLGPLAPLRARCRRAICWFSELWAGTIPSRRLDPLRTFDVIGLSYHGSVAPLQARLPEVQIRFVPPAVDTLAFQRDPELARPIDMLYMGRRDPGLHAQLQRWANAGDRHYVFTTARPGALWPPAREHRQQLAAQIGRARHFMVHPAKFDAPQQTRGQQELGFRYFEGLAAGAALVGNAPQPPVLRALFDWEDSVFALPPGDPHAADVLSRLDADPERVLAAGARNACHARQRHDWVHRWLDLLAAAGVEPTPAARARAATLRDGG